MFKVNLFLIYHWNRLTSQKSFFLTLDEHFCDLKGMKIIWWHLQAFCKCALNYQIRCGSKFDLIVTKFLWNFLIGWSAIFSSFCGCNFAMVSFSTPNWTFFKKCWMCAREKLHNLRESSHASLVLHSSFIAQKFIKMCEFYDSWTRLHFMIN